MKHKKKILVAGDDKNFSSDISEVLKECGCDVAIARNGDVQELIKRWRYDLFITEMYGLKEIEFLQRIKIDDSEVEVVILSGGGISYLESMTQVIVEYLNKPGNGNGKLTEIISRVFSKHEDCLGDMVKQYGIAFRQNRN